MALDPKPVTITRVATGSYTGAQTPQPLLMVGDPLADPVASDADVSALVDDGDSDTRASLDAIYEAQADLDADVAALVGDTESDTYAAIDTLYDFATLASAFAGYSGSETQTLKHVSGTLTWVTDGA